MTAATSPVTRPATGRTASVALWTLQVLLAAVYLFSAYGKLSADPLNVAGFEAMGLGVVGMYVIGALELAGAVGLLVPRLMGLAATCFVALMIGAVVATVAVGAGAMVVIPLVVGVLVAVVAWGRRENTAALVASLRS